MSITSEVTKFDKSIEVNSLHSSNIANVENKLSALKLIFKLVKE